MSKRLLQIDSCLNMLSTGRITESIGKLAKNQGWECYIVHGARYARPGSCMHPIRAVSKWGEYVHFAESLLLDNHGLASRKATRSVVEWIRQIKPDVIHLHCVHGYFLNYRLLFEYLNTTNIPLVWTFHDCWAFTGHCAHFVTASCKKWKTGCHDCPLRGDYPKSLVDRSYRNYAIKKNLFGGNQNLHIVAVSEWMASFTRESFLGEKDIRVIQNGVDLQKFKPVQESKGLGKQRFGIIGVASAWGKDKGLYDFYKLREVLSESEYDITLVGLTQKQIDKLPQGIKGIMRTESIEELARLYSSANVLVNPTYADSFPTVNMEALACGTPVITYRTGGGPEIVDEKTGVVVEQGDVEAITSVVQELKNFKAQEFQQLRKDCRKRAEECFDKDKCFERYISLYGELMQL